MLDTDVCVHIARRHPKHVEERFLQLFPGELVISAISFGELQYGAAKSAYTEASLTSLRRLVSQIPVVELNAEASRLYGNLRAELERRGRVIGNNDMWIAAHALSLKLTLVTNNVKEFERVPGLSTENWVR